MFEELCKCGHEREDHYVYCNNGNDQSRCRRCDPFNKKPESEDDKVAQEFFCIVSGSRFDQMNKAADHDFVASPARNN